MNGRELTLIAFACVLLLCASHSCVAKSAASASPLSAASEKSQRALVAGEGNSTRGICRLAGLLRHSDNNPDAGQQSSAPTLEVGDQPIAFSATDISGNPVSLRQYKGKIVLLDFWATWCEPCCEEVPNVVAAYNKFHSKGFDVLAVSLDDDLGQLRQFIKAKHVPYRQICDKLSWEGRIAQLYGVDSIPHSILIGRTGVILAIDPRGTDLEPAIRDALANKLPATNSETAF